MSTFEELNPPLEQASPARETIESTELPQIVKDHIMEAVNDGNAEATVERIDGVWGERPPRAIDSNPEIGQLIDGMKDSIDTKYLEAPEDMEQIKDCATSIKGIEGATFEEWRELDESGRANVLCNIEQEVAKIAHRPACEVVVKPLSEGNYGFYDSDSKTITINSDYLKASDQDAYKECIDTILHEGRHAYQDYNLTERQVHPNEGDIRAWRANENGYGYLDAETYGFESYYNQPEEIDARTFAANVVKEMQESPSEHASHDIDWLAHMARISSGSEQQHWLDELDWAKRHVHNSYDIDWLAHMARISSGSEQQHWLDELQWAKNHVK